jgi:hypothetical protein
MNTSPAEVANHEVVFRIIRRGIEYQGEPPNFRITPANFVRRPYPKGKEPGLSVFRDSLSNRNAVLENFLKGRSAAGYKFGESTAELIRTAGFDVLASPRENSPGHASIRCSACNLLEFDCALPDAVECELEDFERRSQLADFFNWPVSQV